VSELLTERSWLPSRIMVIQTVLFMLLAVQLLIYLVIALAQLVVLNKTGAVLSSTAAAGVLEAVFVCAFALTIARQPRNTWAALVLAVLIVTALALALAVSPDPYGLVALIVSGVALCVGSFLGNRRQARRLSLMLVALCSVALASGAGLLIFE
jgi:asparagine N-glycosylation enzyme membrane subunit Stt3